MSCRIPFVSSISFMAPALVFAAAVLLFAQGFGDDSDWDTAADDAVAEQGSTAPAGDAENPGSPAPVLEAIQKNGEVCSPPCRRGYTCIDGNCISVCNPPCPPGTTCDPETYDCVPDRQPPRQTEQRSSVPASFLREAPAGKKNGSCGRSAECAVGYICLYGTCSENWEAISAGNVFFNLSLGFYALGTLYSSIAPIIWSLAGYHSYVYDDYYYDSYYYDDYDYGYDNDVFAAIAPQTACFLLFGALNRAAVAKQMRYLKEIGGSPSTGLAATSWLLYGLSICTSVLNIFSFVTNEQEFATTTAIINAGMLTSSMIVNIVAYANHRGKLRQAVENRRRSSREDPGAELVPYVRILNRGGEAGMALLF